MARYNRIEGIWDGEGSAEGSGAAAVDSRPVLAGCLERERPPLAIGCIQWGVDEPSMASFFPFLSDGLVWCERRASWGV